MCPEAKTTLDMEECGRLELQRSEAILDQYYKESLRVLGSRTLACEALIKSQEQWLAAREAFARAVYESYSPGTMAGPALLGSKIDLTRQRAHELWSAFIRTQQSELTEPEP